MTTIKAIFWDSDNTLIDTFALHWAKHVFVLKHYGVDLSPHYQTRIHHNNGAQNWEWIVKEFNLNISKDDYLHQIDTYFSDHSHELKLRSKIGDALDLFDQKNLPQIVVSNGRRNSVESSQKAAGILNRFKFLMCKEDYEGRKPDPAPFTTALNRLNESSPVTIAPQDCLAIDDDPLGVESAHRAGMITIFRPTHLVAQTSPFADYTVTDDDAFLPLCRKLIG